MWTNIYKTFLTQGKETLQRHDRSGVALHLLSSQKRLFLAKLCAIELYLLLPSSMRVCPIPCPAPRSIYRFMTIVYLSETVFISDCLFQAIEPFSDEVRKKERRQLILTTTRRPLYLQQRERWFPVVFIRK